MQRLRSIQVLRFVASTLVVISHTTSVTAGAMGVDVFFAISGFIIYGVAQGRAPLVFLRDRAIRILPTYYLFSVPWILLAIAAGLFTPAMAISTATLWPVFGDVVRPALKSGWSLSFEILFYACTAMALAAPRLGRWLPALWAAALVGALLTGAPVLRFVGNPIILEFAFGVAIARSRFRSPRLGALAIALALGVFGWFVIRGVGDLDNQVAVFRLEHPWRWLVWGVPGAALVWGVLQFETLMIGRGWAVLEYLGDASYATYLTNLLVSLLFKPVLPPLLLTALALGVGVLGYRFVEQPLLRILRRPRAIAAPQPA